MKIQTNHLSVFRFMLVCAAFVFIALSSLILVASDPAHATPPQTMNFQGRLMDSTGTLLPDGNYNMQFRIYTTSTGGSALWTETRQTTSRVAVTNGLFAVQLGEVTPLSPGLFTATDLYFEITMPTPGTATCDTNGCASWESPMTPRNKLATSAYAFNTSLLNGKSDTDFAAATGSTNYLQNTTSPQTASFSVTGSGAIGDTLTVAGATTMSSTLSVAGAATFKNNTDSTTAFRVQNAANASLLTADTTNMEVTIVGEAIIDGGLTVTGAATFEAATLVQADSDAAFRVQGSNSSILFDANTNTKNIGIGTTASGTARLNVEGRSYDWVYRTASNMSTWRSVTYANNLFVAVANNGTNRVMTSPDGSTWTNRSAAALNGWNSVTYGDGLFVAVSSSGTNRVMTSPDGITWTGRSATGDNSWSSVTYGNGLFVAVSGTDTNRVMTSPDGITWTARTAAAENNWVAVTYGNGTYVAVSTGGGNRVMTSPDGITWTSRSASSVSAWRDVTYGGGLFVAVSETDGGKIMTSPDGITWTDRSIPELTEPTSVTYGDGLFVTMSQTSNSILTSPDGITWTAHINASTPDDWRGIAYGNDRFVAVGQAGDHRVRTMDPVGEAMAVQGSTSLQGYTKVKTDSIKAFEVQNAAGIALLTADTINNRLVIGVADTVGTLLVLDTKTNAGDPTGVDGAMYYNSNAGKFRCFEGGGWKDCIASANKKTTPTAQTSNYTAADGDFVIANSTGGSFTVTLPAPTAGAMVSVKKVNAGNAITVNALGGVYIDDQTSYSLSSQWLSQDYFSDGTQWYRI